MRRLIETLTPVEPGLYWRWVGGVLALYVVVTVGAAGVFINHESSRTLRHEPAATVAKRSNSTQASIPMRPVARYE